MSTPDLRREMDAMLFEKSLPTQLVGQHLIGAVAIALGDAEADARQAGWQILSEMVLAADPIDERGRHPYVAARHLLGLIDYPTDPRQEIPYTQGQSWNSLKGSPDFPHAPPRFPLSQGRRLALAAMAGGYGVDRTLWRPTKKPSRPQLVGRITDDFIRALESRSVQARSRPAQPTSATTTPVSANATSTDRDERTRWSRGTMISGVLTMTLATFLASALWIAFSLDPDKDFAGSNSKKSKPSNTLTSYWRAGWGPDRPTFTVDAGATYPAFNSVTDNPEVGDERNFVSIRHVDSESVWHDDLWAEPGDELLVRVYVSNSGFKNSDSDPLQEAIQQARVELGLSEGDNEWSVFGTLSAVNAQSVWDGATVHTDPGVDVVVDAPSAKIETNAGHRTLSSDAFSPDGTLLGYEQADGLVRPTYEEAEYVTVQLRVVESESRPENEQADKESAETEATKYTGGWGPERTMYSVKKPADYTVLNSLKDNPAVGDERNFVRVKHLGDTNSSYTDTAGARVGDELVVYAYVDNGANDTLGIAAAVHGLTARLYLPGIGTDHSLAVTYKGENAAEVWDGASVITSERSQLTYVRGSAEFHSASAPGGRYGPKDGEFERGVEMLLGHQKQDGLLPIGQEGGVQIGNGYLTFRIRVVDAA